MIHKIKKINLKQLLTVIFIAVFFGLLVFFIYSREFSVLPDASISLMNDVKEPAIDDKVMIIAPHPDDETIAAGAYIERTKKNQSALKVVLVTDGNRWGKGVERYKEFETATGILGASKNDLQYLNLPEFYLHERVSQSDLTSILSKTINDFNPTILIYPEEVDANPDHKYIGEVINGIVKNNAKVTTYKYLVHWDYFPRPIGLKENYNLTPPAKLVDFHRIWQRFMLKDNEEMVKLDAVLTYKTQLKKPILNKLLLAMVRKNELFDSSK